jgi:diguanylate cyclase (GGDEF)-like protein
MKTVRDLSLWPLWVNPEHRIRSALVMMRGHKVSALGVLKGDEFLGILHLEDTVGVDELQLVETVMRREVPTVTPDTSLKEVAQKLRETSPPRLVVLDGGKFLGIVCPADLLGDVGRNYDPLTGLPWGDALREWGIQRLQDGREITLLFFDLDEFGAINKEHGHLVGDRLLCRVADALRSAMNPEMDFLCRYGGDEFVVGTERRRAEAELFAEHLLRLIRQASTEGVAVSASVGIQGGRRTKERESVHFAATVDNLINLASRASTEAKQRHRKALEGDGIILVQKIETYEQPRYVVVTKFQNKFSAGIGEGEEQEAEAVARATLSALRAGGWVQEDAVLRDVMEIRTTAERPLVFVVGYAGGIPVMASRPVERGVALAAAEAVWEAFMVRFRNHFSENSP